MPDNSKPRKVDETGRAENIRPQDTEADKPMASIRSIIRKCTDNL